MTREKGLQTYNDQNAPCWRLDRCLTASWTMFGFSLIAVFEAGNSMADSWKQTIWNHLSWDIENEQDRVFQLPFHNTGTIWCHFLFLCCQCLLFLMPWRLNSFLGPSPSSPLHQTSLWLPAFCHSKHMQTFWQTCLTEVKVFCLLCLPRDVFQRVPPPCPCNLK